MIKIRVEYNTKEELDNIIKDFKKIRTIKLISKTYTNYKRPEPYKYRIYVEVD